MAATTITFELEQPPEAVFDYVADVRNEATWQKDILRVEKLGDAPVGEGTEFDAAYRLFGRMRLVLHEYRRPTHLVFDAEGPRMRMRFTMDVEPHAGGSRVAFAVDMRPRGVLLPLAPLLRLGLPREMAKRPDQFRAALATA